jgi:hypothetical protein
VANTNDSTTHPSQSKASGGRPDAYGVHPNSLLNSIKNDPELYKAYKAWMREVIEDSAQFEAWAKDGYISWGDAATVYDVYEGAADGSE